MKKRHLVAAFLVGFGVAGCSHVTAPEWVREIGLLHELHEPLAAPGIVRAGVPFSITVTTAGSSSCTRASGASVRVEGLAADVVPMDERRVRSICTGDLAAHPRSVSITFMTPGTATLRVSGVGTDPEAGLVTIERVIQVDP